MDTVYAAFLDAVCTHFLPEARRIAGQSLGQLFFRQNGIDKLTDHGVLAGTDQVEVFALDLVHHAFHFGKGHYAGHHVAADHERRNVVGKALVDHKVAGICQNGGVQPCNIAAQIIEAVTAGVAGCVDVDAVEFFHNVHVIRHFEIRHNRLAETLYFHVFGIVLTDRHGVVNEVRDHQHDLADTGRQFCFCLFQFFQLGANCTYLCLDSFGFFLFSLSHESTDLLADRLPLAAELVALYLCFAEFLIQFHNFIYQRQLFVLKLLANVFFDFFRIVPDPFHIDHDFFLPLCMWDAHKITVCSTM